MEYVRLTGSEKMYGSKALLYAEMELLDSIKHIRNYKKLRIKEIKLKTELKKTVKDVKTKLSELDKALPKNHSHKSAKSEKAKKAEETYNKKRKDLQSEIDEIQRKLQRLSS